MVKQQGLIKKGLETFLVEYKAKQKRQKEVKRK
jgi:hypothetical protein